MNWHEARWVWKVEVMPMPTVFVESPRINLSRKRSLTGYATSLFGVMRNIGSSVGISFVTTWVARRSQFHQSILVAHVTPYDLRSQEFLGQVRGFFFHRGFDWGTAGDGGLGVLYGMLRQQVALISFVGVFRVMGYLFLATVPLVLLTRKARQRRAVPAAD
jgi:DHA2 family multidrug resistance protein